MAFDLATAKPIEVGGGFDLSTAKPVGEAAPEKKPLANRANALTGGVNRFLTGIAGLPIDTAENVLNIGKVAIGAPMVAAGRPDLAPEPTSGAIGGSEWFSGMLRKLGVNTDNPNPQDQASQMLYRAGTVLPNMAIPGAGVRNTIASAAGAATGEQIAGTPGALIGSVAPSLVPRPTVKPPTPEVAARNENAANARESGLTIPPSQTNPTILNKAAEGIAGKLSTAQAASAENAPVINGIARKSLNLSPDTHLTDEVLAGVRAQAGGAYDAVKSFGAKQGMTFKPDAQFTKDIDGLGREYSMAAKRFPEIAGNAEVETLKTALSGRNISPAEAIELSKKLRADAATNYKSDNPAKTELAHAQRAASNALEDFIDRRLMMSGQPDLVKNFREARSTIARTYDIEGALNTDTGNVSAAKIAALANRGRPLGGGLEKIASFGNAFPKAAQRPEVIGSQPGWSPLDSVSAAALGLGGAHYGGGYGALAALLPALRPAVRATILSGPYQRNLGVPAAPGVPESDLAALSRMGVLSNAESR